MSKYIYPAFVIKDDDAYIVKFPDLPNCYTDGQSLFEALENAEDALCLMLYSMEEDGMEIPAASSVESLTAQAGAIITLICCDTLDYKQYYDEKN